MGPVHIYVGAGFVQEDQSFWIGPHDDLSFIPVAPGLAHRGLALFLGDQPFFNMCTGIAPCFIDQYVTYNRHYPTQKQFADAILAFFRKTLPQEWSAFRDKVADNFRVISHDEFRVFA
jgi:hypothetical protein